MSPAPPWTWVMGHNHNTHHFEACSSILISGKNNISEIHHERPLLRALAAKKFTRWNFLIIAFCENFQLLFPKIRVELSFKLICDMTYARVAADLFAGSVGSGRSWGIFEFCFSEIRNGLSFIITYTMTHVNAAVMVCGGGEGWQMFTDTGDMNLFVFMYDKL